MKRPNPVLWRRLESAAREEVEDLLHALPPPLRSRAGEVPVVFEPAPSKDLLDEGVESDLLGLFVGADAADFGDGDPLPPEIILFLMNLWDYADGDAAAYREEVRRTLMHELGHYLGLGEDDLVDRDLD